MPEAGRKQRHLASWILARPIPPRQGLNSQAMPEVMQPGPLARADRAQARAARQRVERSMNMAAVEPIASARDKQIGGNLVAEELRAPLDVIGQVRAPTQGVHAK